MGLELSWVGETGRGHGLAAQWVMCLYMFKGPMCSVHQLISEVQVKSSMSINSISAEKSEQSWTNQSKGEIIPSSGSETTRVEDQKSEKTRYNHAISN